MAVAQVGSTSALVNDNDVGPISPVLPDTTAGNVAYVVVGSRSSGDLVQVNADDGSWVRIAAVPNGTSYLYVYRRVLTGGDANPSVTATSNANALVASVKVFSGVDNTTPEDVAAGSQTGSNNVTLTAPSVTTVTNGAGLLRQFGVWHPSTAPTLSSPSEGSQIEATANVRTWGFGASFATQATAGSTGTATMTSSSASDNFSTITIALRPAGGASSILPLVACDMANMADMKGMRG